MEKLSDGAVVKCCGECDYKTKRVDYDISTYDTALVCRKLGYKEINPKTIDSSCPLASVEVVEGKELFEHEDGGQPFAFYTDPTCDVKDISKIIIVYKTGEEK